VTAEAQGLVAEPWKGGINKSSRGLQSGTSRCNALPASQRLLIHVNSGGFATECSLSVPRSALQPVAMVLQAMEQLPMFS
jgi:hypothetical protein